MEQLGWLGLSPRSLAILGPYITLLPARTPVNLNTASVAVLQACIAGLDLAQAQRLASARQSSHFRSLADASKVITESPPDLNDAQHSVQSRFFEIQGRLRMEQTVVQERSVATRSGLQVKTCGATVARAPPTPQAAPRPPTMIAPTADPCQP